MKALHGPSMPVFFVQINLQIVWLTPAILAHKFRALMKPAHFGAGFFYEIWSDESQKLT